MIKKIDLGIKEEFELDSLLTENERYEIEVFLGKIKNDNYKETVPSLCKKHNVITFDELIKKTTEYFKEIGGKVEYLFVDEFQDIGPLEKKFFIALNADNYFYVGDEKQRNL
jgi:superfamily I DNA/RNA helicase